MRGTEPAMSGQEVSVDRQQKQKVTEALSRAKARSAERPNGEAHAKALSLADEVIGGRQMTAVEVAAFARLVRVALVGAA